ncbi:MAG: YceI family protein [Armatimonadetes bacterium]|nr:YceI family protein [Armatimonadota bacterium]
MKSLSRSLMIIGLGIAAAMTWAAPKTFTVVGEKLSYRNVASVESVAEFETFVGRTNNVSGKLSYDPAKKTGSGMFSVDVASIDTGIPLRNEHMRSPDWLNAAKYPSIKFESTKVAKASGDDYKVTGKLTIKGKSKVITVPARIRYRAEGEATKKAGFNGDVIQISSSFKIKLSEFGVVIPQMAGGKVSDTVTISLSAYATTK